MVGFSGKGPSKSYVASEGNQMLRAVVMDMRYKPVRKEKGHQVLFDITLILTEEK